MLAPRNGATVAASTESWESKLSNSGAWDFKVLAADPWYRSRRLVMVSVAAAVAAMVVTGILVLMRGPGVEESVSPANPTTGHRSGRTRAVQCTCSAACASRPTASAADRGGEITGPVATRSYDPPRRSAPSHGHAGDRVTRTPVTRLRDATARSRPELVDSGRRQRSWGRW